MNTCVHSKLYRNKHLVSIRTAKVELVQIDCTPRRRWRLADVGVLQLAFSIGVYIIAVMNRAVVIRNVAIFVLAALSIHALALSILSLVQRTKDITELYVIFGFAFLRHVFFAIELQRLMFIQGRERRVAVIGIVVVAPVVVALDGDRAVRRGGRLRKRVDGCSLS